MPVAETLPAVNKLPPDTLALVTILEVELIADTTFELKLNPAAFKLPLVIFPLTDTVVPVCVVALTLAPPKILPPVILPVTDRFPVPVNVATAVVLAYQANCLAVSCTLNQTTPESAPIA